MTENTEKMCYLLNKYHLSDKVTVSVHRDHHGLYIAFEYHDMWSVMPDFWFYNGFEDRCETWRCMDLRLTLQRNSTIRRMRNAWQDQERDVCKIATDLLYGSD